jgi:hypothetical protein
MFDRSEGHAPGTWVGELDVEQHRPTFVWQVEPVEGERSV